MSEGLVTHRRFAAAAPESILYPVGVEQGAVYSIISPGGSRAVINDPNDRDFVGYLTEPPSGLDGATVRESADSLPEGDGGIHGAFYEDRMPFTLSGLVYPDAGASVLRQEKLKRACKALRSDGQLLWTPSVALIPVRVLFRSPNPPRITDRRPKKFLISGVSAQPWIESQDLQTSVFSAAGTATNKGGGVAWPVLTVYGPRTNPVIANSTFGGSLSFAINLATSADYLVIDTNPLRRSVTLNTGANRYSTLNFATANWFGLGPGDNALTIAGAGAGLLTVDWRHTWGNTDDDG